MDNSSPNDASPVTSPRQDFVDSQTENTSDPSPSLVVSPLRDITPFGDSGKVSYDADAGPSTGPIQQEPCHVINEETHMVTIHDFVGVLAENTSSASHHMMDSEFQYITSFEEFDMDNLFDGPSAIRVQREPLDDVNNETHIVATAGPPPVIVTSSSQDFVDDQTENTPPASPPIMVSALPNQTPFDDSAYAGPPPIVVTNSREDFVEDQTENTSAASPPMVVSPLRNITPSDDSDKDSYDVDDGPCTALIKREPCDDVNDQTNITTADDPPLEVTPLRTIRPSDGSNNHYFDAGAGPSTAPPKRGRGRPKGSKNKTPAAKKPKTNDANSRLVKSCPSYDSRITEAERETGSQEIVDSVMMRFDAVRRRLCQLNHKGILTTALPNCSNLGVQTNTRKRIGPVPGVRVGDIFYFWGEMCLVGLHKQAVAGIDYLTVKDGAVDGPVATSVVTSGQYDDETEELDTLIYTGHGGTDKHGNPRDQNMERGNLALQASITIGNEVRVIRGKNDPYDRTKKIYIYDGLYLVSDVSTMKGKSGYNEFKFKLVRKPDQPSTGYAIWKAVEDLKEHDSIDSREGFILRDLSFGVERIRVPLVNEVDEDDKTMPEDFDYIRSQEYSGTTSNVPIDRQSLGCQTCQGQSCIHQSLNCMCMRKNDGVLPYHNNILVCRKPLIYESGASCPCPEDCKTRLVQTGLKLRMEVFKTANCGWGLRSWDPIRAGTFICEYAGVSKTKEELEEDDDYLFDSSRFYKKFRWNYEPELAGEAARDQVPEDVNLPMQVLISAKEKGNVGRFMNHSCSPNVFWQPIEYENNGDVYVRIGLFAMKHIPPMTELTYDYGVSSVEESGEDGMLYNGKKICLCGSDKCRGSFG